MEKDDVNEDFGENVIIDRHEAEPQIEEEPENKQEDAKQVLESVGIIKDGEVIDAPPALTPTQKQKEYKRKMTEKRLDALRKAREAKALKRKQKQEAQAQEKIKPVKRVAQAPKQETENEEERIERLVQARLAKSKPAPKAEKAKETEEERIERLVQERLKKHTPKQSAPTIDPAKQAKLEREAYFSKLMFGE